MPEYIELLIDLLKTEEDDRYNESKGILISHYKTSDHAPNGGHRSYRGNTWTTNMVGDRGPVGSWPFVCRGDDSMADST